LPEWFLYIVSILSKSWVLMLSPAIFIFFVFKDRLAFRFVLLTAAFFLFGNLTASSLRAFDDIYIYRYLVWAITDIIWMALIAYWGIKDKVYLWQCVIGQLVVIGAPILQLFRLVDRHLWDLAYSTVIYQTLMPFINIATVVVCYLPLIILFTKQGSVKSKIENSPPSK
jgi:hypothetical protein|tara:strand:- start:259 stop:765 length:507 start_codon:yes stop_codon:yes gene_type:complete